MNKLHIITGYETPPYFIVGYVGTVHGLREELKLPLIKHLEKGETKNV